MPNRDGRRKKRSEREPYKSTDLGFYCIFTDTKETEENYFDGLKISLPESIRERIEIKVFSKIKTEKLPHTELGYLKDVIKTVKN